MKLSPKFCRASFSLVALLCLSFGPATVWSYASQTVVNTGSSFTFSVPAISTNYLWRLDAPQAGTNGLVGSNSPSFTYSPAPFDVGTHVLACYQTLSNGLTSNTLWQVRTRIALPNSGINYYVATNGSDSNAGTLVAPFLTLDHARDVIRGTARPLQAGGITVYLFGGTYFRTNTLMLNNVNDFGSSNAPIVYKSYPGQTAVISGGKPIAASSWLPLNSSQTNRLAPGINPTNIWELDLGAAGITHTSLPASFNEWTIFDPYNSPGYCGNLGELIYNDQRMWLSRYPNHNPTNDNLYTSYMLMNGVATDATGTNYLNGSGTYTDSHGSNIAVGGAFYYNASDAAHVSRWQSALTNGGAWIQGYWRVSWQVNGAKLAGVDTNNLVIEIATNGTPTGGFGSYFNRPAGSYKEPFWALNLLEEMDQPGEWAMDFHRNRIYFYAPGPLADGSVMLSDFAAPLVQIANGSNLVFQSLTFDAGLAQGVYITNGLQNLIVGCTFENFGNYPVDIQNGGTNGVVDCNFHDLAGGGVLLRGGTESSNAALRVPARDYVVNNAITNFGVVTRVYAAAVDSGYGGALLSNHQPAVGMRVTHNLISGSPHAAILHGSWDSLFAYNDIGYYQQVSDDLGAFYSFDYLWRHGNHTLCYNFMHDTPLGDAIYFDVDHWQMHLYGNIANLNTIPAENQGIGLLLRFSDQVTNGNQESIEYYNNMVADTHYGAQIYAYLPSTIEENAMFNCATPYQWTQVVLGSPYNTQVASTASAMQSGPNAAYTSDPGFISLTNNDLRLLPTSPVYSDMPKFTQIPFEMIGLYNDEIRTNARGFSPYVTTAAVTALGTNFATLNGALFYPQFDLNTTVFVYWGTNDAGTNSAFWQNVISFGVTGAGNLSTNLTNLAGIPYFYRFFATNVYGQNWASTSATFTPYGSGHIPASITWMGDGVTNVWDNQDTNNLVWLNAGQPVAFYNGDTVTFDDTGTNNPPLDLIPALQPAAITINATQNYTFAGPGNISGICSLTKNGTGTLVLLTTNNYSGPTVINNGTVQMGNGTTSGTLGTGNVTNNGSLIFDQPDNTSVNGVISGIGSLTKSGAGTLTLAGVNTFANNMAINGGAVAIASDANLGAAGNGLAFNGGALQVAAGGNFSLNNRPVTLNAGGGTFLCANTLTVTNAIGGPGSLTMSGSGSLILTASNSFAGGLKINSGTVSLTTSNAAGPGGIDFIGSGSLQWNGMNSDLSPLIKIENGAVATIDTMGNNVSFASPFASGSTTGSLAKTNSGGLTISAVNSYSGGTAINGGYLVISSDANLGAAGGPLSLNGGGLKNAGTADITTTRTVTLGANGGFFQPGSSKKIYLNGKVTGSGALNVCWDADSVVLGSAANNYSGNTVVGASTLTGSWIYGILRLGVDNAIPYGPGMGNLVFSQASGKQSIFDLNGHNAQVNGLLSVDNFTNSLLDNRSGSGAYTLTVGNNNASSYFGGVIMNSSGKINLAKLGAGILTLSQSNGYAGNTLISGGSLALAGNASIANSALIAISNNAIFDVSGLTNTFVLGSSQTLSNNAATTGVISGNFDSRPGIDSFSFSNGTPALLITNGNFILASTTTFRINALGNPLLPGTYKIIAKSPTGNGGMVTGTPPATATVSNGPTAGVPSPSIANGELYVTVGGASAVNYNITGPMIYDGTPHAPNISFVGSTGAKNTNFFGTNLLGIAYSSQSAPTDAGSYTVSNTVASDANYFGTNGSKSFNISPAASSVSYSGPGPFTYDGTPHSPAIHLTGSAGAATTNYLGTNFLGTFYASVNPPTNAGVYLVSNSVPALGNYLGATNAAAFIILPATNSLILRPAAGTLTYGQNLNLSASVQTNGAVAVDATGNVVLSVDNYPVATNALLNGTANFNLASLPVATHQMTGVYLGDNNYSNSASLSNVFTVTPATPVLTAPTAAAICLSLPLAASSLTGGTATNASNNAPVVGTFAFANPSLVATNSGATNITVIFTPQDTTNYAAATTPVAVTVNPLPATSAIQGPATVPAGATVGYSVTPTPGSAYGWRVPADASFSGGSSNAITVTFGLTSGILTVTETNASGCTGSPQSLFVNLVACAPPAITGGISATATNLCAGDPLILTLTNVVGEAPLVFQWQTNGMPILDATNASYTNLTVALGDASNYACLVTNNCGSVTSSVVRLTVNSTMPVITYAFTNLTLSANGNCQALMPDVTGTNYVLATDACSPVLTITQTPTNNAILSLGTNLAVIAIDDGNGNTAYSTNTVIVQDQTPPTINQCAAPETITALGTNTTAPAPDLTANVLASDNCSGVLNFTQSPAAGTPLSAGTNLVVISVDDGNGNTNACETTVTVIVPGPAQAPRLLSIHLSSGNIILLGTNGIAGNNYYVLTSTNLTLPLTNWSIISTSQFGNGGSVNFTSPFSASQRQTFYILRLP